MSLGLRVQLPLGSCTMSLSQPISALYIVQFCAGLVFLPFPISECWVAIGFWTQEYISWSSVSGRIFPSAIAHLHLCARVAGLPFIPEELEDFVVQRRVWLQL